MRKSLTLRASKGAVLVHAGATSAIVVEIPEGGLFKIVGLEIQQKRTADAVHGGDAVDGVPAVDGGEAVVAAPTEEANQTSRARVGGGAHVEEERWGYALLVRRGRLELLRCALSSEMGGCSFISADASADLRCCQLRHAAAHGLLVSGRASVSLSHCHVHTTGAAAIEARGRARVAVHACRIHHSQRSGVFGAAFSSIDVEHSNLFHHGFAGLEVNSPLLTPPVSPPLPPNPPQGSFGEPPGGAALDSDDRHGGAAEWARDHAAQALRRRHALARDAVGALPSEGGDHSAAAPADALESRARDELR